MQTTIEILLAIIVGITQGVTEFLPISSTAHMRIVSGLMTNNRDIGEAVGNFIQLGTAGAVILYFRQELRGLFARTLRIITSFTEFKKFLKTSRSWIAGDDSIIQSPSTNPVDITIAQLIVGTVPIAFFGFVLRDIVDQIRDYSIIAVFLIFGSGLMFLADYYNTIAKEVRNPISTQFTLTDVILIGLFQVLAIFPGISRSGATLSGALMLGHHRKDAVKFSFLLSIPAISLAGLFSIYQLIEQSISQGFSLFPTNNPLTSSGIIELSIVSLIIGFFFAFISGYIVLKWLLAYLESNSFKPFIIYRLVLAFFLLILWLLLG